MPELTRTPEVIAAEINTIKAQTREVVCRSAIEIGRRLTEAKCSVPYGRWGTWLSENVDYSERTAQDLIRIYEEYGSMDPQALAGISYTQALLLTRLDGETRAELLEAGTVPEMSTRELEAEIVRLNREIKERQVTIEQLMANAERDAECERAERMAAELQLAQQDAETAFAERDRAKVEADKYRQQAADGVDAAKKAREEAGRLKEELEALRSEPPEIRYVDRVPEEVQTELDKLRRQAQNAPDEKAILIRDALRKLIQRINIIHAMIEDVEPENPELAASCRAALRRIAEQLSAS